MTPGITEAIPITAILTMAVIMTGRRCRSHSAGAAIMAAVTVAAGMAEEDSVAVVAAASTVVADFIINNQPKLPPVAEGRAYGAAMQPPTVTKL